MKCGPVRGYAADNENVRPWWGLGYDRARRPACRSPAVRGGPEAGWQSERSEEGRPHDALVELGHVHEQPSRATSCWVCVPIRS